MSIEEYKEWKAEKIGNASAKRPFFVSSPIVWQADSLVSPHVITGRSEIIPSPEFKAVIRNFYSQCRAISAIPDGPSAPGIGYLNIKCDVKMVVGNREIFDSVPGGMIVCNLHGMTELPGSPIMFSEPISPNAVSATYQDQANGLTYGDQVGYDTLFQTRDYFVEANEKICLDFYIINIHPSGNGNIQLPDEIFQQTVGNSFELICEVETRE